MTPIRRGLAFLKRDIVLQASYRAALPFEIASVSLTAGTYYFIGRLVDPGRPAALGEYATQGYFGYAISGVVLSHALSVAVRALADDIRQGQLTGTFESLFLSPVAPWEVALWSGAWGLVRGVIRASLFLLLGAALGVGLGRANWPAVVLTLLLSVAALFPFGVLVGAFVVATKRAEPLPLMLSVASTFLAGVYFPVSLLPQPMHWLSAVYPLTHAVRAFRGALLLGRGSADLVASWSVLAVTAVILSPLAFAAFSVAVRRAKSRGDLAQF